MKPLPWLSIFGKNIITVCPGSILSDVFDLAPASCVTRSFWSGLASYTILSRLNWKNSGFPYTVKRRILVEASPTLGDSPIVFAFYVKRKYFLTIDWPGKKFELHKF